MSWSDHRVSSVERLLFRSRLVKVGTFDCPANHACFPHTGPLQNDLLVFVRRPLWWRRGVGRFRFLEPGAALLHRAGREIERRGFEAAGDRADWFGIRPDVFEETLAASRVDPDVLTGSPLSLVTEPGLRWRVEQLVTRLAEGPGDRLQVEETVLSLLDAVTAGLAGQAGSCRPRRAATRVRRQHLVDRTRAWLHAHPGDRRGLDAIAAEVGTSAYHLCRIFRDECGLTLHAYRQRQRIGRAITCLSKQRQDLSALALELGYSSHSHFSRVFRRQVGVPPSVLNGA